jgi:hypothetical protein
MLGGLQQAVPRLTIAALLPVQLSLTLLSADVTRLCEQLLKTLQEMTFKTFLPIYLEFAG